MRRKTVNVRAAKARAVDYTGHGRDPSDDEYRRRAEDMRWDGVDSKVSYWATAADFHGLKVDPVPPNRFATNKAPWGGVWHITLGKLAGLILPSTER